MRLAGDVIWNSPTCGALLSPVPGAATLSQQSTPWKHPLVTVFQRLGTFGNQTGSLLPPKQGAKMKGKWETGRPSTPSEKISVEFHQPLLHLFLCLLHQQSASLPSMNCTVECIFLLLSLPDAIFQGLSSHEPKRD